MNEETSKKKRVRKTQNYVNKLINIEILEIIITNIEFYRERLGISKFKLSNEAQVGKNTISEIYKKEYMPSILTLEKISNVLNVPVFQLLIPHKNYQNIIEVLNKSDKN